MLFWISLLCAVLSAATIGLLLFRHWKEIRLLDADTIKSEQERSVRKRIVKERFERQLKKWSSPIKRTGQSFGRRLARSIQQMESHLKTDKTGSSLPKADEGERRPKSKMEKMLELAEKLAKEKKVNRAEKIYLEILKIDMRNSRAYQGLGELYVGERQYRQAKETFQFLVSLQRANDRTYAGLAKIAEAEGDRTHAEEMYKKALESSKGSAERTADLAEHYLKHQQTALAWQYAKEAMQKDPENARYIEISTESAILLGDHAEAERLYQELRMRGYDEVKLDRIREKLDEADG